MSDENPYQSPLARGVPRKASAWPSAKVAAHLLFGALLVVIWLLGVVGPRFGMGNQSASAVGYTAMISMFGAVGFALIIVAQFLNRSEAFRQGLVAAVCSTLLIVISLLLLVMVSV